jgi:hypothetical protein
VFAENLVFSGRRSFFIKVDWAAPKESRVFTVAFLRALSRSGSELQGALEISFRGLFRRSEPPTCSHCRVLCESIFYFWHRDASMVRIWARICWHLISSWSLCGLLFGIGRFQQKWYVKTPQSPLARKMPL